MESWAKRIKKRIDGDGSLSIPGLARACGIKQPSVFQWFNDTDSKPATKMLSADNLIRAAAYLNMDPVEIMTGESGGSHSTRLDAQILAITEQTLDEFYKLVLGHVPVRHDPEEIAALYPLIVAGPEEEGSRGALIEFSEWWRRKKKDELVKESGEGAGDTAGIPSERKIKAAGGRGR